MRRFFIDAPLSERMAITHADARHIASVLRLAAGTVVWVSGQDGKSGRAEIVTASPERVELRLLEIVEDITEPPVDVWLVQGLAKGDKMDFIIQKAVELGVRGIIPVATDHIVVRYDIGKQAEKKIRWQRIAREAAKQCGRHAIPEVCSIADLAKVLDDKEFAKAAKIMLYEGQASLGIKEVLAGRGREQTYLLFIGPEGGFSSAEVALCRQHEVSIVTMGPRIMRTETAALAALTAVMYECGDLGG